MSLFWAALAVIALPASAEKAAIDLDQAGEKPADFDQQVHAWFQHSLRDADSAKIEESRGLRRAARRYEQGFLKKTSVPAWYACYRVNAKNAYGGYSGWQTFMFAFRGGNFIGEMSTEDGPYQARNVEAECNVTTDDDGKPITL